ncbi:MAG: hypothetical protein ACREFD_17060, partial [Stellaceae bacterium]
DTRLARDPGPVRCRFTPASVKPTRDRIELISQLHPLTRFVTQSLQQSDAPKLRPAVAARIDRSTIPDPKPDVGRYVIAIMRWSLGGTIEIEKLAYAGLQLGNASELDDDIAEVLAIAAATNGTPWPEVISQVDYANAARLCDERLINGRLNAGFTDFLNAREAENEDRASIQLRTLERHLNEQTSRLNEIRDRHRIANRPSLVRATEGRIEALNARCEQRQNEIEKRKRLNPSTEDIAALLVEVT